MYTLGLMINDHSKSSNPYLEVLYKTNFGKEYFWPLNDFAKILCQMMDRKTFSRDQLEFAKKMGWNVHVIIDPVVI